MNFFDEIMNLEDISKWLQDKRLYVVADATGLSYPTIQKLANAEKTNYTIETLIIISKYIKKQSSETNKQK